jgi:hypothetical protein
MNRVQVRSHRLAAMKGLPIFLLGFTLRVEVIAIVPIIFGNEGLGR